MSPKPPDVPAADHGPSALDRRPSMVRDEEFLWAVGPRAKGTIALERVGKWLLMGVRRQHVDDVWVTVKALTERDMLGHESKVSTAFVSPLNRTPGNHVVVVYSKDWRDTTELRRMLAVLREHGLGMGYVPFKRDVETYAGKYVSQGNQSPSVWIADQGKSGEPVRLYTKWLGGKTYLDGSNDADVVRCIEHLPA